MVNCLLKTEIMVSSHAGMIKQVQYFNTGIYSLITCHTILIFYKVYMCIYWKSAPRCVTGYKVWIKSLQ